jgi:outer membrane protein OmpA-like peptidoglycan-associated protein
MNSLSSLVSNDDAAKPAAPVVLPATPSAALTPPPPPATAPAANATPPALTVPFAPADTSVSPDMKAQLDGLATRLKQDDSIRVSVVAHAAESGDQASVARRTSLARALAVRAYLIDQGVDNLRINVQAEGSRDAGTQPDRVDLFLLSPVKG